MTDFTRWRGMWPSYSSCHRVWNSDTATFGPGCAPVITHLPLWIAVTIFFFRYATGPIWRRRPLWLRGFASEPVEVVAHGRGRIPELRYSDAPGGHNAAHRDHVDDEGIVGQPHKTWSKPAVALLVLCSLGISFSVLFATLSSWPLTGHEHKHNVIAAVHLTPLFPCLVAGAILAVDRPQTAPGAVFLVHSGLVLTQLALLVGVPAVLATWRSSVAFFIGMFAPLLSVIIILRMPLRDPRSVGASEIAKASGTPNSLQRSPEDNFTMWHWMTVSWMGRLIAVGHGRQIHPEDVWRLPYERQHRRLHLLFRELKGSVISRLLRANAPDLMITSALGIFESAAVLSQIVLFKQLLAALEGDSPRPRVAVAYAAITLLIRLAAAQSGVFSLWFSRRCYERSRGEMITMIYEKTIRRKAFTFPGVNRQSEDGEAGEEVGDDKAAPATMGKILNLMRNDAYEVAQRFWEFPQFFTKPLNFVLSLVLIWRILGPASLVGMSLLLTANFVSIWIIRVLVRWEKARRAVTDVKLQLTSQFIETLRHLRWYDWQDKWLNQILEIREVELRYRVWNNLMQKVLSNINQLASYAFPVIAFYAYTVLGGRTLTVDVAFPALSLFTMLNNSLQELPNLVVVLLNANVAMSRIENYMLEPEKEEYGDGGGYGDMRTPVFNGASGPVGDLRLKIAGPSYSWPGAPLGRRVLRDVHMECVGAGLTVICGKVGAGKSALLQAILGELDMRPGREGQPMGEHHIPDEMVGYCAQTPWLQSMSIRENILFSSGGYDEVRYRRTLDACALLPDLAEFEGGDLSMMGENGVGLSGGQKARVALARAVYSRARVLLLDDPIAALDHHTATTVVRKLFSPGGLCADRMVVFVTHRIDVVRPFASQMYEVSAERPSSLERLRLDDDDALRRIHSHDDHQGMSNSQLLDAENQEHEHGAAIRDKFVEAEYRAHGGVMASVYWRFVKAGRLWLWALLILAFINYRGTNIFYFFFLRVWGDAYKHVSAGAEAFMRMQTVDRAFAHRLSRDSRQSSTSLGSPSPPGPNGAGGGDGWLDGIDFGLPPPDLDVRPWLFWFMVISIAQVVAQVFADVTIVAIIYRAGRRLFADVMRRVSAATFRFYDVTPVGRLMNRVTSDISAIDGPIASMVYFVGWYAVVWVSALFVIAAATPSFLVLALIMTAAFVYFFQRFLPLSQSLRRLETVSLSPLMSNFGTLVEGLTTVRAFRAQPHFEHRIIVTTDAFQQMDHFYWSLQTWLAYRFDTLSAISTFALTITALRSGLSSGTVAFVLSAAATFVDATHSLCRKYGELQMMFVSVERVVELLDLDTEVTPAAVEGGSSPPPPPPASWPSSSDDIVFDNVTLRYAPSLDPSLRNVSFRIPAGATVAVTGRTGSGKSTLALALLGTILPDAPEVGLYKDVVVEGGDDHPSEGGGEPLVGHDGVAPPPNGSIWIGDVDIAKVDKHALRRRVTFVAQDPVLFPGTLRENLDPLEEFSDEDCAQVLARVLAPSGTSPTLPSSTATTVYAASSAASSSPSSPTKPANSPTASGAPPRTPVTPGAAGGPARLALSTRVDGGGKNLSQGQRQLVGIARAVLRRSPVVILDEATASIDVETSFHIQEVLRQELTDSTVIAIAHRTEAVRDADFRLELDKGRVVRAESIVPLSSSSTSS